MRFFGAHLLAFAASLAGSASAATLRVGPGQPFPAPSVAIAAAADGDTVLIAPGEYFDCAVVARDRLTIAGDILAGDISAGDVSAGSGKRVVLTDLTCEGKAILVTTGAGITVRDLTLTRARVPDRNGAGIRAEGRDLTVERVRFVDNEDGLLANAAPGSTIRVLDSEFTGNGRCAAACAHAVYVGPIALLDIENTRFFDTREGHHIKSRAARTRLIGDDIADGPEGTAAYLVELPDGGDLDMRDDTLEKGPRSGNPRAAIVLGDESAGPADARQAIAHVTFRDDTGSHPDFVLNWGSAWPALSDNKLPAGTTALTSDGLFLHRLHGIYASIKLLIHGVIGAIKQVVWAIV